jgi:tripartite-type tricarboxylate transporter receptor subunit TctC
MTNLRAPFIAALALVAFASPPARADDFYKGKTFTIVVGFSPGGGYDVNARTLARRLAAHIPGNPSIIVQNMPGAGSLTAARYLDVTAPKDGTVMTTSIPASSPNPSFSPRRCSSTFASTPGSA